MYARPGIRVCNMGKAGFAPPRMNSPFSSINLFRQMERQALVRFGSSERKFVTTV